jgi:putative ABC transport system permease protein
VARQGLANLHRPHNQTLLVLLSVGFGAFLVFTLLVVRSTLLSQVRLADEGNQPNLIFFDIQADQLDGIRSQIEQLELPIVEEAPIVNMRLSSVLGSATRTGREGADPPNWVLDHEYRSTYRGVLSETEELIKGEFVGRYNGTGAVPISLEEGVAEELEVDVGDTLVFDVQGRSVETVVGSIRLVDWNRMQTNFFVVFPDGVLEAAPQTFVVVSRAADAGESGRAQASIVQAFPNVSAVDLTLIIEVIEELFSRLAAVIQFMALFSIATGLLILAGAVAVSRFRRADEVVLLKALGASRSDVRWITAVEYLGLGLLSSVVALVLATGAGWLLARYTFVTPLVLPAAPLAAAVAAVVLLTALIGVLNSRGVYRASAVDVLRRATEA